MEELKQEPSAQDADGRITSVDAAAAIDQFGDPGLLSAGKINLIALDAIISRLGGRWATRRDHIHDYVDRTIQRRLGPHGYHLRISETDFLICQPEVGRFSGQAACLQILRDVLLHFIGDAARADECVHQVTKISATEIHGSQVRVSEVEEGERLERDAGAAAQPRRPLGYWTPFVATDGRELSVTCSLEPVIELKAFRRIGFRVTGRVFVTSSDETVTAATVRNLPRADIVRIDLATVACGMELLRVGERGGPNPSLIVPVSFTSLSSQRGRTQVNQLLVEAKALVRRGVICEIIDIEGVPQGTLLQVVSLIRPYCLFIVARIDPGSSGASALSQLKHSGVHAVSVECPQPFSDNAWRNWVTGTLQTARRLARSILLYRVASRRQAEIAAELGATHASFR